MKKIICTLISLIIIVFSLMPLSAFAAEEKIYDDFLKYVIENGEVKITKRVGEVPEVIKIPSKIDGCPVTTIGEEAFYDTIGATEIILPDTIITIEKRAFNLCRGTIKINIPDGVKTIGDGAFGDCSEMLEGIIPDSVENFGERVFKDCESLVTIKIPDHFTKIPAGTYDYCEDLYDIVIPDGITEIGESAFNECVDIVSINIPKSLKKVGEYAFYCCEELQDIYYTGTEAEWKKIDIGEYNDSFKNATVHYEYDMEKYIPEEPDPSHRPAGMDSEYESHKYSLGTEEAKSVEKQNFKRYGIIIGSVALAVAAVVVIVVVKKKKTK